LIGDSRAFLADADVLFSGSSRRRRNLEVGLLLKKKCPYRSSLPRSDANLLLAARLAEDLYAIAPEGINTCGLRFDDAIGSWTRFWEASTSRFPPAQPAAAFRAGISGQAKAR